jgi:uncharacterized membrane protein YkoI
MKRKTKLIAGGALAVAVIGGGAAVAVGAAEADDQPLTGSSLERATEAALAHTGGGTVVETEVGDDGAAYGVEIRLQDGRVVEVNLDANFGVIGSEPDEDRAGEAGDSETE